jgi:hypothetical protein
MGLASSLPFSKARGAGDRRSRRGPTEYRLVASPSEETGDGDVLVQLLPVNAVGAEKEGLALLG